MAKELPFTRGRLSQSIVIRAYIDTDSDIELLDNYQKAINNFQMTTSTALGVVVGGVQKISRQQKRKVFKRYSLGENAFEPFQVVPLGIDTKLTMERVVFYKSSVLEKIFAFTPRHLIFQQMPFIIQVEEYNPKNDIVDLAITLYTQCWFVDNPIEYDVTRPETLVIQKASVEVGKMIVIDSSLGGLGSTAEEALETARQGINLLKDFKI